MHFLLKGIHIVSKQIEIRPETKEWQPLEINSACETIEFYSTVQDSEFVRWSSALHHVLVFIVKKRWILFIDIIEYTL